MDKVTILKQVIQHALLAKVINNDSVLVKNIDTLRYILSPTNSQYIQLKYSNTILLSYSVNNLIAYCGGINFGDICIDLKYQKSKVSTLIFITELIWQAICYKAIIYTTNNKNQNGWCEFIRRLINISPYTIITTQEVVNANTGNAITLSTFNSYELSIEFKKNRYDQKKIIEIINTYLNLLMPVPKEELKPTPIIDAANTANNKGAAKSDKAAPIRAPQVRKKYRSQWATTVLDN